MCLEVRRRSLLAATQRARVAYLRRVDRVSASDRDFLTKNIGLCFRFLSSLNRGALIEASNTAR